MHLPYLVLMDNSLGVKGAAPFLQGFAQPVKIGLVVFAKETGFAVVPTLHNAKGNTVKMDVRALGHEWTCIELEINSRLAL